MQDFYSEEPITEATATEEGDASTESGFDLSECVRKNRAFAEEQKKKLYNTMNAAPAPLSEELKKALIEAQEQAETWKSQKNPNGSASLKTPLKLQMPKIQDPYLQKKIQEKGFPKIELPPS